MRQKCLPKDRGIRKLWKQSRTSVVAIAMENVFNNSLPVSDSTSTPSGKAISIRSNPPEDNSRTPGGGTNWAFESLARTKEWFSFGFLLSTGSL